MKRKQITTTHLCGLGALLLLLSVMAENVLLPSSTSRAAALTASSSLDSDVSLSDAKDTVSVPEDIPSPDFDQNAAFALETASALAADLLAGNYEALRTDYTYDLMMKPFVASGQLESSFSEVLAAAGALLEQKPAFVSSVQQGYTNVDVPCLCQKQPWNLTVTFAPDETIAGLHVSAWSEGMPSIPQEVTETEQSLAIEGGRTLPGTFTAPAGERAADTAVVFVHGSGASDRDETVGSIRPFQDLAWGLAQRGIASYRYDKISFVYPEEISQDPDFTIYDETVNDAAAAVQMVKSMPGIRSVYVLGHSQGGMMMGAIASLCDPDGCILMAAPAQGMADLLEQQVDFLRARSDAQNDPFSGYEALINALRSPDSLQPGDTVSGLPAAYVQSLAGFDAIESARAIQVPTLVLQGEEDYQVSYENFLLWKEAFGSSGNWSFVSFPGLTHLFTEGSLENGPDDYIGEKHIPQEVIDCIADHL